MKEKAFFGIFKGLSLKQIKPFFFEDESPTLKGYRVFSPCYLGYLSSCSVDN